MWRLSRTLTRASLPVLGVLAVCALAPAAAQATIEQGHPELYVNGALGEGKSNPSVQAGFGEILLSSPALPSEGIECVNLGFGSGWNEEQAGVQRGIGQLLAWDASGHAPSSGHPELQSQCRPHNEAEVPGSFATDEAPIKSEENGSHEVEPSRRRLSVPWNVEFDCGVRSKKFVGIIKIGVPDSEFPKEESSAKCPAAATAAEETKEIESYKKEAEEKKGCFQSIPAPEGCIRVVIVEPGAGLELAYGGTLHAHGVNGSKNGLSASKWSFEGGTSGVLQCETAGCTANGTTTGEVKELGYKGIELIQGK